MGFVSSWDDNKGRKWQGDKKEKDFRHYKKRRNKGQRYMTKAKIRRALRREIEEGEG